MAETGELERGNTRYRLIRAVAQGERNQLDLAEDFGCTQSAISRFIQRHAGEIMQARNDLLDRFGHLWVADKGARIAELQQIIEDIEALGEDGRTDPEQMRVKLAALRSVAEELGQLPARMVIKHEGTVRTEIVGADLAALR